MDKDRIREELDAFIESGKAKVEVNSGNFVTTHIDPMKIAEHFYEQAEKDFIEKALAYLNEKFYFNNLHYAVENNTFNCMEEMFEDFEKYLRGE